MSKHWTEVQFIEHGELFLKYMLHADQRAVHEIEALETIFSKVEVRVGDRVLDVGCGYGRHSLRLAEKGFLVTGIDLSPIFIQYGRAFASEQKLQDRVEFLTGDARHVYPLLKKKRGSFKAVISMWSSLGFYDDETDEVILRQLSQLVSRNGVLILDVGNRDFYVKHPLPFVIESFEDCEIHEHWNVNWVTSRSEALWTFYKRDGDDLQHLVTYILNIRSYSLHELIRLIEIAGWEYTQAYGNFEFEPITPDTDRIIIIGMKARAIAS